MKNNIMRFTLTLLTLILFGGISFANGNLNATENLNSEFKNLLVSDSITLIDDTLLVQINDCTGLGDACVDIAFLDIFNYQIQTNGMVYNNGLTQCDFDTITRYNYTLLFEPGPYILQSWMINGVNYPLSLFTTIDELVTHMNAVDPLGAWVHDPVNELITGGFDANLYTDMVIFVTSISSPNIMAVNQTFEAAGTNLRFPVGLNEVVFFDNNLACSDTMYVQVQCIETDTIYLNFNISDSAVECLDFSELLGDVTSVTNICPGNSGAAANFMMVNGDSCIVITSFAAGTDQGCFVFCDDFGFCDTTIFIADVTVPGNPGTHFYTDTVNVGDNNLFCINTSILPGAPDTIYNICPSSSGSFVSFLLDPVSYCVTYTGVAAVGTDTACVVVCDAMNNCDTTFMYITSLEQQSEIYYDTLYTNQSFTFCNFDLSELAGPLDTIYNDCPNSSGAYVDFMINPFSNCVTYDALSPGKDSACIILEDNMGNTDTVLMIVCVLDPQPEIIIDTIRLDDIVNYCLDGSELAGNITDSIFFCDPALGTVITTNTNDITLCIDVAGINIGTDSFCVYICDDNMVCDTTYFYITVEQNNMTGPVANDDADITTLNTTVVTDVCFNDSIPGSTLTNFYILDVADGGSGPINGAAIANNDCTITYIPENGFCDDTDQYTYVICNSMGCDTANVNITVECPSTELIIYDGFSPNNDGVNDFFTIAGIENYPNSILRIYNRWGERVLEKENYLNDWGGDWEGLALPDGVYFYALDDGEGEVFSGSLMLTR